MPKRSRRDDMPLVLIKKRKERKARVARRYGPPPASAMLNAGGVYFPRTKTVRTPMPQVFKAELTYADTTAINPGAGTTSAHHWRLNSIYDPDFTGGGHQPRGMQELENFYGRYTVVGGSMKITITSPPTVPVLAGFVVAARTSYTVASGAQFTADLLEAPQANRVYKLRSVNTANPTVLYKKWNTAQVLGLHDIMSDGGQQAAITGNPGTIVYGSLYVGAADGAGDPATMAFTVELKQTVMFTDLRMPSIS